MADIVHRIEIAAPPPSVFALVAAGEGFTKWWAEDVIVRPGGIAELGFFQRTTVYRLRLESSDANRSAAWRCETGKEWEGTRIVFELEPGRAATLLRFRHADWAAATDYFVSCNTTWGELMFRLKAEAEGHPRGPLFRIDSLSY